MRIAAGSLLLFAAIWCADIGCANAELVQASWTVMVYLNGDNHLESFALENWKQMALVGSTRQLMV